MIVQENASLKAQLQEEAEETPQAPLPSARLVLHNPTGRGQWFASGLQAANRSDTSLRPEGHRPSHSPADFPKLILIYLH